MLPLPFLRKKMRNALNAQNTDPNLAVDDNTVHQDVLKSGKTPGLGLNSSEAYKASIRALLSDNGHEVKKWPTNWLTLSIKTLAPQII